MRFAVAAAFAVAALSLLMTIVVAEQEMGVVEGDETQPQPISEEPIKFVHVLNPGEREYLSPNLIGVQNIAMTFLPLSINFVNIIDAFREIVDGVRYEILLNAVDTKAKDADVVCRLVIIEKPWLRTEWGDKVRELRASNCTNEEDTLTDMAARSKALNDKYTRNAIFNGGTRNELSDDDMSKLESQILTMPFAANALKRRDTPVQQSHKPATTGGTTTIGTATTGTTPTTTTTMPTTPTAAAVTSTEQSVTETETEQNVFDVTAAPSTDATATNAIANVEDNADATTTPPVLTQQEVKWLDDYFSVGALSFEDAQREKVEAERLAAGGNVVASASNNDVQQEQQQQQQLKEVVVEGVAETQAQEQTHNRAKRSSDILGGITKLETKEAEECLQASLDKLAAGDGPNYRISKIYSATRQIVSGSLTKLDAELIDENDVGQRCNIKIWSQPWLPNGYEVTFKCPNKELIKRRHSRSVEHLEKKNTHKKFNQHNLNKAEHLFNKFQVKYNRRYSSAMEQQMRLRIFKNNLKIIQDLNKHEMGSAKYGITEFADLTTEEYRQRTGLLQRSADELSKNEPAVIPDVELPKEFDWREKGVISKVKNQGVCGSCWAFSVTGNVEGLHAVKTGKLEEYSEQELLDCDTKDSACNGGMMDSAYEALKGIGGLELESDYPYEGRKQECHFNRKMVHVKVKGGVDLPKNETAIAQWLIQNGPVSIGINANAMQFYRGGVSHPWKALCSKKNLDHGVLIVGYGVSDYPMFKKTLPYWIVKNSWGTKWGEQGYYRVYRGDNTCGVSEMASSAVLAD